MVAPLLLYNQSAPSEEDFIANFVARGDVLATLRRRLQVQQSQAEGAHQILVGPRGMGKSSLLRRLAIAVSADEDLKRYYVPLTFREEQYNVLSCGDFWRNCGEALAEWAEKNGQTSLADRLDRALGSTAWAGDEDSAEQFLAELKQLNRRALLLVDNIDLILDAIPQDAHWSLRREFQKRGGPIVIGAATHLPKQSADRNAAFYEFFQPHHLEPLDEPETERCMRALAQRRGEPGQAVLQVLNTQPERLKTLHALTGGNPRVLTLIYRLLEVSESDAAMADLDILLDQVTPYYKARIEEYQTAQQRAVIDAIALHWDPITAAEISHATNIAATTLPNVLAKLRKDGLIEPTDLSGSSAGHQIAERFLNIWYLMRHGTRRTKHKMRWLVQFLTIFYSPNQLADIADRVTAQDNLKSRNIDYAYAVKEAARLRAVMTIKESAAPALIVGEGGGRDSGAEQPIIAALEEADFLEKADDNIATVAVIDNFVAAVEDYKKQELRALVAAALLYKAAIIGKMGRPEEGIAIYDDIVARFEDLSESAIRECVAQALVNRAFTIGEMGDEAAEVTAYDEIVARFGDAPEPAIREQVAQALVNRAITIGAMGDKAAEVTAYDEIVARFGDAPEPAIREQVAQALVNRAMTIGEMGDKAAAVTAYDEIVGRFGDSPEPAILEWVAKALFNRALTIGQRGDKAAAVTAYDEIVGRFGDSPEPAIRKVVAQALVSRAITIGQIGDTAAEHTAYDELVARFGDSPEPAIREQVGKVLLFKAYSLQAIGEEAAALGSAERALTYFDLVEKQGQNSSLAPSMQVVLADLLIEIRNDLVGAEALYRTVAETAQPQTLNHGFAWLSLLTGKLAEARAYRDALVDAPPPQTALLDAAFELAQDNFGAAMKHFGAALNDDDGLSSWVLDFGSGLYKFIRFADQKGYGDRLVVWFEDTGLADQLGPLYVAVKAYVRGEQVLLDVNPETRGPARVMYDRLAAPRRYQQQATQPKGKARRQRGRPRKA